MKCVRASRTLGVDTPWTISPALAEWLYRHGYRYALRYIDRVYPGRGGPDWLDYLSRSELSGLIGAGLGVGVVQRAKFRGRGYLSDQYGRDMGRAAALCALRLAIPTGVTVWCDAEWTDEPSREQITDYLNGWSDAVKSEGYRPGLYVGSGCAPPLSAGDLYQLPRYKSYWQSVSRVQNVATRGFCLVQSWEYVLMGSTAKEWSMVPKTEENKRRGSRFDVNMSRIDNNGGRWYWAGA